MRMNDDKQYIVLVTSVERITPSKQSDLKSSQVAPPQAPWLLPQTKHQRHNSEKIL